MPRIYAKNSKTTAKPDMITATDNDSGTKRALDVNLISGDIEVSAAPEASELHLGEIGGSSKKIAPTVTVDTAVYTIGDVIGGKLTLTDAMRVSGGTGLLQNIYVSDASGTQRPALEIILFNANPTVANPTDQAAFAPGTDVSKIIGRISVYQSDYTLVGGVYIADIGNLSRVVQAVGSANLYAVLVAASAPDFVAATDLVVRFGFLRD